MSLWTDIHQIAIEHPEGETRTLARQFLTRISDEQLIELLADAIANARRNDVRAAERDAFTPVLPDEIEIEGFDEHVPRAGQDRRGGRISREQFAELLDRTFALDNHRSAARVSWGAATVTQHRARIEMLQTFVRGTLATIDRHEAAIALIEEEGASCLDAVIRPELIVT